jgi:hypothetical protein
VRETHGQDAGQIVAPKIVRSEFLHSLSHKQTTHHSFTPYIERDEGGAAPWVVPAGEVSGAGALRLILDGDASMFYICSQ